MGTQYSDNPIPRPLPKIPIPRPTKWKFFLRGVVSDFRGGDDFSSKIRFLNKNGIVQKQSIFGAKIRFFHFFQSMKKHRKSQNSITPQKSVTTPLDPLSRPLPENPITRPTKQRGVVSDFHCIYYVVVTYCIVFFSSKIFFFYKIFLIESGPVS